MMADDLLLATIEAASRRDKGLLSALRALAQDAPAPDEGLGDDPAARDRVAALRDAYVRAKLARPAAAENAACECSGPGCDCDAMRKAASWDEDKHPRDGGKFAPKGGGGGSSATPEPATPKKQAYAKLRDIASKGAEAFSAVKHKAQHVEHVAQAFVADGIPARIEKLPKGLRGPAKGVWYLTKLGTRAAFATYTAGQAAAERVAAERGSTPEQAARLRGVCTALDLAGAKAGPLTLSAVGLGGLGFASSFVPVGSFAYLAYSTARDPLAVLRAARKAVAGLVGRAPAMAKAMTPEAESSLADLADRLDAGGDDYAALFLAALDATGDFAGAIRVADGASGDESDAMHKAAKPNATSLPPHRTASRRCASSPPSPPKSSTSARLRR